MRNSVRNILLIAIIVVLAANSTEAFADSSRSLDNEIIVKLRSATAAVRQVGAASAEDELIDLLAAAGFQTNIVRRRDDPRIAALRAPNAAPPGPGTARLLTIAVNGTSPHSVAEAITVLQNQPNVEWAEPNLVFRAFKTPNDPFFHSSSSWGQGYRDLWGLERIDAPRAWDLAEGEGVVVAVIDSGVDYRHPDLAENIWRNPREIPGNGIDDDGNGFIDDIHGFDFTTCSEIRDGKCIPKERDGDPLDGNGHGTHVAGTIAAQGDNGIGIVGVAPKAKIMAVRALGDNGAGALDDLADAVLYAINNGADVINASFGALGSSKLMQEVFDLCIVRGVVCVAAAGNDNADARGYTPASLESVIAVGATDPNDKKAGFSNYTEHFQYGPKLYADVDVAAPGGGTGDFFLESPTYQRFVNVLSLRAAGTDMFSGTPFYEPGSFVVRDADGKGLYYRAMGTSMAAPHVSGVAALVISHLKRTDASFRSPANRVRLLHETRARLVHTSDPLAHAPKASDGTPVRVGSGRINAYRALTERARPEFRIVNDHLFEVAGNGNGVSESGETYELRVELENLWASSAGVRATLVKLGDAPLSITRSSANFGAIAAGERRSNDTSPFVIRLGSLSGLLPVDMALAVSTDEGTNHTIPFRIVLGAKRLSTSVPKPKEKITEILERPFQPQLSGNRVVWTDTRFGQQDVFVYDFATGQEILLTRSSNAAAPHPARQAHPAIDGDLVVWEDGRNGNSDIYMYNLRYGSEPVPLPVPASLAPGHQIQPTVDGDYIAWTQSRSVTEVSKDSQIYLTHLRSGETVAVTAGAGSKLNPVLKAGRLAYEDTARLGILLVPDLTAPTQAFDISSPFIFAQEPSLAAGRIAYSGIHLLDGINIYVADIPAAPVFPLAARNITKDFLVQGHPAVSGDHLVWQGEVNGRWEIFYRNLATGSQQRLTAHPLTGHFYPAVSDRFVVWISDEILWAARVPGSSDPDPQPPLSPPGDRTVSLEVDFTHRGKKGNLEMEFSLRGPDGGDIPVGPGECIRELYGATSEAGPFSYLGRVNFDPARNGAIIKKMPGIKPAKKRAKRKNKRRRNKARKRAIYLESRVICPAYQIEAKSDPVRLRTSRKAKRQVAPARWLKLLTRKLI